MFHNDDNNIIHFNKNSIFSENWIVMDGLFSKNKCPKNYYSNGTKCKPKNFPENSSMIFENASQKPLDQMEKSANDNLVPTSRTL